jgi:hypothetical protein
MLDIQAIRRRNTLKILNENFRGVRKNLAARMNEVREPGDGLIQPSYVTRILKEGASGARQIGDDMARRIEKAGEKPGNWLDQNHAQAIGAESVESGAKFGVATVTQIRRAPPTLGRVPLVEWDVPAVPAPIVPSDTHWIGTADQLDATSGIALRMDQDLMCSAGDPRNLPVGCYIVVRSIPPNWEP